MPRYKDLPLLGQYGPETGVRGKCQSSLNQNLNQQARIPKITDYKSLNSSDKYVEQAVLRGPILSRLYIPIKLLQFYTSGVVTADMCYYGSGDVEYNTVTTGFTRVGYNGSGPFWQVRGSFGTNWGIYGLMWVEKKNDESSSGPCRIHQAPVELIAKKY